MKLIRLSITGQSFYFRLIGYVDQAIANARTANDEFRLDAHFWFRD
ncbi:MAG: hypothetical protein WCZ43_11515 [Proteiniphilum sp.]